MKTKNEELLKLEKRLSKLEAQFSALKSKNIEEKFFDLRILNGGELLRLSNYNGRLKLTNGKIYEVLKNDWIGHKTVFTIRDDNEKLLKQLKSNTKKNWKRVL